MGRDHLVQRWACSRKITICLGFVVLSSACATMQAQRQLTEARTTYQTHLDDIQQRAVLWQANFQELEAAETTFQAKLTNEQAERLNRARTLKNTQSQEEFLDSLGGRQRDRFHELAEQKETLEREKRVLVQDLQVLRGTHYFFRIIR